MAFWAEMAWVGGQWQHGVRLQVGSTGLWQEIETGVAPAADDQKFGVVLPGLVKRREAERTLFLA